MYFKSVYNQVKIISFTINNTSYVPPYNLGTLVLYKTNKLLMFYDFYPDQCHRITERHPDHFDAFRLGYYIIFNFMIPLR